MSKKLNIIFLMLVLLFPLQAAKTLPAKRPFGQKKKPMHGMLHSRG
jgi:hypothetical protein